ncbi:hypothetical protein ACH4GP_32590 [Streptomyces celluloflavus]|uniref:Uncharacterized protein n=1 Tax=Streptomyces celluloflavus TaxID=58344 RepID=A0ABW7RNJ5_9ACTN
MPPPWHFFQNAPNASITDALVVVDDVLGILVAGRHAVLDIVGKGAPRAGCLTEFAFVTLGPPHAREVLDDLSDLVGSAHDLPIRKPAGWRTVASSAGLRLP